MAEPINVRAKCAPYPAWWIAQADARMVELDRAVSELPKLFANDSTIHNAIVFGSFARSEIGPKSDLDILVIQESDESQIDRTAKFYQN